MRRIPIAPARGNIGCAHAKLNGSTRGALIGEKRAVGTSDERALRGDEDLFRCEQRVHESRASTDYWTKLRKLNPKARISARIFAWRAHCLVCFPGFKT